MKARYFLLFCSLFPLNAFALFTSQPVTKVNETELYQYSIGVLSAGNHDVALKMLQGPKGMRIESSQLVWQTTYEDAGEYKVVLEADDGVEKEQQSFSLTVVDKNRAPVFNSQPVTRLQEGQLFQYPLNISDADGDKLTVRYLELPSQIKQEGNTLTWQTDYKSAGIYPFHIRISDGKAHTDQEFVLTVSDSNRLPEFDAIDASALQATENQPWQLTVKATDADGDKIKLSLENAPEGMRFNDNQLTWKPSYNQAGSYTVNVLASDGKDSQVLPLNIEVKNVNRLPNFILEPKTQLQETDLFRYDARAYDPDETLLQYQLLKAPEGMSIDSSHIVTWQTTYEDAGTHEVVIEVSDGEAKIEKHFSLTVSNKNRAPEIQSTPVTNIKEGERFSYQFQAVDADGDPLKIDYLQVPKVVKQDGNVFTWQTDFNSAGQYHFHIRVSDGQATVEQKFSLQVENVNHQPEFTSKPDRKAIEAIHYRYDFSAKDADNEPLSFSLVQAPKGMRIENHSLLWVPGFEQSGSHHIILAVSDGIDSVEQAFDIEVANTNREPTIQEIGDQTIFNNEKYSYQVNASDADGDAVTLSLAHAPKGMSITRSGEIRWKPKAVGDYTVIVKASDGDLETIAHFDVTVVERPAPVVEEK